MYKRIIVPIDGSKPADKASDHTICLTKSISVDGSINKIEIIILYVIPELPATLGFEPPRRSILTWEVISFSEYTSEMQNNGLNKNGEIITTDTFATEIVGVDPATGGQLVLMNWV